MDTAASRVHGPPAFKDPSGPLLRAALAAGWRDFRAAPAFGLMVGLMCIAAGWGMLALTYWAGHTFWLVLGVFGFPLAAPFAALGTYEVSRQRSMGRTPSVGGVLRVLWEERGRQVPPLGALIMSALLFWFFLGHMIFALFLGLKPMTNIMSSGDVFLSSDGLMMLALGSVVGAAFATLLYAMCVLGLPMLLDREVDYVTAMLRSIGVVRAHPLTMLGWALFIAVTLLVSMLPAFLGLLVVLPWLGHASWHVYAALRQD